MISKLEIKDCLDVGCAQPYLLQEIVKHHNIAGYGCDLSDKVIATNREQMPHCQFMELNLECETWPQGRQFDLVTCSEVLEHINDWQSAVENLTKMTKKYLLITVPTGEVRPIDKMVGHYRHFQGSELVATLGNHNFTVHQLRRWGFPVHSLYKNLINNISAEKVYDSFSGGDYTLSKKLIFAILYRLFYFNDFFNSGSQLILLAQPN